MTLTLGRAAKIVESTLGGSPSGFSSNEIAGLAGDWLVNTREWRFLENSTASLDTEVGTLIHLPADLRAVVRIFPADNLTNTMQLTGPTELLALETTPVATSYQYKGVLSYMEPVTGGVRVPILRVWPAFTTVQTGFFTIWYHATWPRAKEDETVLPIPQWIEGVYIQAIRAYAKGLVEEDAGGEVEERLERLQLSQMWRAVEMVDEKMQRSLGRIEGGAVHLSPRPDYHWNWDSVQAPS